MIAPLNAFQKAIRQRPLHLPYDHAPFWATLQQEPGCTKTACSMMIFAWMHQEEISFSRRKNDYHSRSSRYYNPLITYAHVTKAIDWLVENGFIREHRTPEGQRGWRSWFIATPKLAAFMSARFGYGSSPEALKPRERLIMRNEDKRLIDYRETRATRERRGKIERFNEAMHSADIQGAPMGQLVRIFNGAWNQGGRFYCSGLSHQSLPKTVRSQILINGEPVEEPDFARIHPTILYDRVGVAPPQDIYDIAPWERDLTKMAVNTILNAKTFGAAVGSIATEDGRKYDEHGFEDTSRRRNLINSVCEPGSPEAFKCAKRLINDIRRIHAPIAEFFHTGVGLELQSIDAQIAERVMDLALRENIVVLPVHDSFIAPRSKAGQVRNFMREAADRAGFPTLKVG